ncbi:MAG TPA: class I SAM-dependent methyltransferase [Gammaproteobacteria bacterium]|nr:class I SAM-dependent methyltransferase [Gammaproteobacteria bacterium]
MKRFVRRIPVVGPLLARFYWRWRTRWHTAPVFSGSLQYWEKRYASGSDSGVGSYGKFADFKAEFLNAFVAEQRIASVIEFGCGDGNQLSLACYPTYLGFDVSPTAVAACCARYADDASRRFAAIDDYAGETAELALALDVLYHLVEDEVFERYMARLFDAATRYVIIYSSNTDEPVDSSSPHVRHRAFTPWVAAQRPQWRLVRHIPNRYPYTGDYRTGSFADFYVFAAPARV